MNYKNIVFKVVNIETGEQDAAMDVKSLAHAVGCSQRTSYLLAKSGGRFKSFLVKPVTIDEFMAKGLKK